ncbi:MAG: hypothetical protein ACFFD8_04370 [Candidatus Thorarchaeota archaeon]
MVFYRIKFKREKGVNKYPKAVDKAVWHSVFYHPTDFVFIGETESKLKENGDTIVRLERRMAQQLIEKFTIFLPMEIHGIVASYGLVGLKERPLLIALCDKEGKIIQGTKPSEVGASGFFIIQLLKSTQSDLAKRKEEVLVVARDRTGKPSPLYESVQLPLPLKDVRGLIQVSIPLVENERVKRKTKTRKAQ